MGIPKLPPQTQWENNNNNINSEEIIIFAPISVNEETARPLSYSTRTFIDRVNGMTHVTYTANNNNNNNNNVRNQSTGSTPTLIINIPAVSSFTIIRI